jgi:hypothetical protein
MLSCRFEISHQIIVLLAALPDITCCQRTTWFCKIDLIFFVSKNANINILLTNAIFSEPYGAQTVLLYLKLSL